jgi:hypothetical protein
MDDPIIALQMCSLQQINVLFQLFITCLRTLKQNIKTTSTLVQPFR